MSKQDLPPDVLAEFQRIGQKAQQAVDKIIDRHGVRAKGAWRVRAGVIPGEPLDEFTKEWFYTNEDREKDQAVNKLPNSHAIFSKLRAEAMDYYLQVSMPHLNNWAELTFIWY